jgi:hypothetical protein
VIYLKGKLTEVWKMCETKQLANVFEQYMKSIGVRKYVGRRKDNSNTYMIDAKSTNWNRVQCYYFKDSIKYEDREFLIVLRKEAGNYLIVEKKSKRAFEVDYSGIKHYNEKLLTEIIEEYKPLFDSLFKLVLQCAKGH